MVSVISVGSTFIALRSQLKNTHFECFFVALFGKNQKKKYVEKKNVLVYNLLAFGAEDLFQKMLSELELLW